MHKTLGILHIGAMLSNNNQILSLFLSDFMTLDIVENVRSGYVRN